MAHKLYRPTLVVDEAHQLINTLKTMASKKIWQHKHKFPDGLRTREDIKKWVIGVGVNFIDNNNSEDNNYMDVSNWNSTLSISKLGVQYYYDDAFSLATEFSLNRLDRGIRQNSGNIDATKFILH